MKLKVHLVFPGSCEEALLFYKETLNGEVTFLFRKGDDKTARITESEREEIGHMVIKTPQFEIRGEDAPFEQVVIPGNNQKLVVMFDDPEECRCVFERFADGGRITQPLEKTFFCERIGELTDRYGISWIIMTNDEGYL